MLPLPRVASICLLSVSPCSKGQDQASVGLADPSRLWMQNEAFGCERLGRTLLPTGVLFFGRKVFAALLQKKEAV